MKKSNIALILVAAAVAMASCSKDEVLVDNQRQNAYRIQFGEAFPDNATRASKRPSTGGTGFEVGESMGIYGYQFSPDSSLPADEIFNNTVVTKQTNGEWTYTDVKYWNPGSMYEFYGIYPQSTAHTFDADTKRFTVTDFTVADAKDDQVDVMIAKKNETAPVNTVDMIFNHLLSNVNFYFKVQNKFNNSGVATYEVVNFDVTGLKSKGTYTQTGIDNQNSTVGAWAVDNASVYTFPTKTDGAIAKGQTLSLGDDLLMMPQAIADDATVTLTYRLVYKDGTSSTFGPHTFSLNKVRGLSRLQNDSVDIFGWEPNYRYNYYLAVNPSIRTNPTADYDGAVDGYKNPTGNVKTLDADDPANPFNDPSSPYYKHGNSEVFWYIDVDNEDGDFNPNVDFAILWQDIDGVISTDEFGRYTTLEGIADRNRNGVIDDGDKFDDDTVNYDGVADDATLNPWHVDVIMEDRDGDGVAETPLQRDGNRLPPDIPGNADVDGSIDGDGNLTNIIDTLDPDDPDNPTPGEDFWYVDTDGDGEYDPDTDVPIIWKDIDGDGKEEGFPDWNGDGKVGPEDNLDGDHTDYNGDPDDPDRNPDGVDVILYDDPDNPGTLIELERDPKIPNNADADWNGSIDGDNNGSGTIVYTDVNDPDTYMIDTDGDGIGDIPIVWEDIDGDGKLEGGVDRDGDGHIDDVDQDGTNITTTPHDDDDDKLHKDPSDLTTTGENAGKDVIMIHTDTNGDGVIDDNDEWKQLEWPEGPQPPVRWGNADADGATNGYQNPKDYYRIADDGTEYIDVNNDGVYDPTVDYPIVYKDLDGTVFTDADGNKFTTLEGIVDLNRNGIADAGDRVDNDGKDYLGRDDDPTLNPDHLDGIMLDNDGDHVAETPLVKKVPQPLEDDTIIRFTADVDEWADDQTSETIIRN
ncbi:MAG: fimbrillin family protein [Bacteroidaceae bacterium]|nr:fimbrillin family protein [Bacteroidaceae bacterium]